MTDTPIDRLRELHRPWTSSEKQTYCQACQLGFAKWPCDTIAALDALEERLAEYRKTATNMRELHDQLDDENEALQARLDALEAEAEWLRAQAAKALDAQRAEIDALQVRLDAATVLIREVDTLLRVLDTRMCGTRLSHFCDFSEPRMRIREWLAGDKEEHSDRG